MFLALTLKMFQFFGTFDFNFEDVSVKSFRVSK